jgi:hypothetical protein
MSADLSKTVVIWINKPADTDVTVLDGDFWRQSRRHYSFSSSDVLSAHAEVGFRRKFARPTQLPVISCRNFVDFR